MNTSPHLDPPYDIVSVQENIQQQNWKVLRLLNVYRLMLAAFFVVLYVTGGTETIINPRDYIPTLFSSASISYLFASITFLITGHFQRPSLHSQVKTQGITDIIAIIMIMHACGGMSSGLGMLLIISLSSAAIYLDQRATLLFAALASIAILADQIYSQITNPYTLSAYTETGILGILLFTSGFLVSRFAKRIRESESLARQRSIALSNVVRLNEHIIQNMRTGIMVIGPDDNVRLANEAAEDLLGNVRLRNNPPLSAISKPLYERYREWMHTINSHAQYTASPLQQSHGLPELQPGFSKIQPAKGESSESLIFLEDAAQLTQRFQQVKLASLGRLTASIAHEIRNPLAAIHHASQLLDETMHEEADKKLTGIINTQVQRLNSVIENVLQISRQQPSSTEPVNLNIWLHKFREEFCTAQKIGLEQVSISVEPEDTHILFDSNHMHQVFWNLCTNSVNHHDKELSDIRIQFQGGISRDSSQPFIDVIDNGPGIAPEVTQQIFDPFFTTSNNGTGLGLYITREVAERNRAKIHHIQSPSGGTCFRVYFLPAASGFAPTSQATH